MSQRLRREDIFIEQNPEFEWVFTELRRFLLSRYAKSTTKTDMWIFLRIYEHGYRIEDLLTADPTQIIDSAFGRTTKKSRCLWRSAISRFRDFVLMNPDILASHGVPALVSHGVVSNA